MTTTTRKQFDTTKGILITIIGVLLLTLITLFFTYQKASPREDTNNTATGVHVSLGSMEYEISDNKAVKRTDTGPVELRSFLTKTATEDISDNCPSSHYIVAATNVSEDQVLLRYGCSSPDARMFALKKDGKWQFITPTNQFDIFNIPACSHVNDNKIDPLIAPVCGNGMNGEDVDISYESRI